MERRKSRLTHLGHPTKVECGVLASLHQLPQSIKVSPLDCRFRRAPEAKVQDEEPKRKHVRHDGADRIGEVEAAELEEDCVAVESDEGSFRMKVESENLIALNPFCARENQPNQHGTS